jgi:hypothetical protein
VRIISVYKAKKPNKPRTPAKAPYPIAKGEAAPVGEREAAGAVGVEDVV